MSEPLARVLDASGLLAMLQGAQGAEVVESLLGQAAISAVNWCEVHQQAVAHGVNVTGLRTDLEALGLEIVPFDADDAELAADLSVTSDRAWKRLKLGIEVETIR